MEVRFGEKEITALLQKIRTFDPAIGSYELYTVNHSFEYVVKVSNGSISFKVDELMRQQQGDLSEKELSGIAGRFIPEGLLAAGPSPVVSRSGMRSGIVLMVIVVALVTGGIVIAVVRNNNNSKRVYIETKVEQPYAPPAQDETSTEYTDYSDRRNATTAATPSPQEQKLEQKGIEMRDPFAYLKVTSEFRMTLIMNLNVQGTVRSTATQASFRNITVRVKFYDKNDELLGQEDHLIPDILAPGQQAEFSFKAVGRYGKTVKAVHELVSATPF